MNCKQIHSSIHDFIDGYCTPSVGHMVDEHISSCDVCSKYLDSVKHLKNALGEFPEPTKTDAQWEQIEDSIFEKIDTSKAVSTVQFPNKIHSYQIWVAAAVLVFMLVSLPWFYMNRQSNEIQLTNAQYPVIVNVHGDMDKNGLAYDPSVSMSVMEIGEEISTAPDSRVIIQADSGSTIDLSGNSLLAIKKHTKDNQTYLLKQGTASVAVAKRKQGQLFVVQTPNAFCEVVGTRFQVDVVQLKPSLKTVLSVSEGIVRFTTASGDYIMVGAGTSRSITDGFIDSVEYSNAVVEKNTDSLSSNNLSGASRVLSSESRVAVAAVSAGKDSVEILYNQKINVALAFIDSGKTTDALQVFNQLITSGSLSVNHLWDAHMRKFRLLKMTKRYSEASEVLAIVISGNFKKENQSYALFQSAVLNKDELHDNAGAIKAYQRYIKEHSNGVMISEAYYSLAELYHEEKQYNKEAKIYEEFIDIFSGQPGIERAVYSLAQLYSFTLNDCSKAVGLFSHLEEKYPQSEFVEDALFWKANCFFTQGMVTRAFEAYRQYIETYPEGRWSSEARTRMTGSESAGRNR